MFSETTWSGRKWSLNISVLLVVCSASFTTSLHVRGPQCSVAPDSRFDCAPDKGVSKEECETRGCCYSPASEHNVIGQPWCFFASNYPTYKVTNQTETENGFTAVLTRSTQTFMPDDIMVLQLDVSLETTSRLRFTVSILVKHLLKV